MRYSVQFERDAERELRRLPSEIRERMLRAAEELAAEPRPRGCKKLKGYPERYRIRVGDYRLVYDIRDQQLVVLVVRARHRSSVY